MLALLELLLRLQNIVGNGLVSFMISPALGGQGRLQGGFLLPERSALPIEPPTAMAASPSGRR